MPKPIIAVTGRTGQVGSEIERLSSAYSHLFDFIFTGSAELDIADKTAVAFFFQKNNPAYFIHCAAYTAVDKAETEQETAYTINAEATGVIAQQCGQYNCTLFFISTDYVFDGKAMQPYQTDHPTDPVNYYGYTKWLGEKLALENNPKTIVIRTSWVYSSFGHNFVKTMLRLMKEREEISVVSDQSGSPTCAADLAEAILEIIGSLDKGNTHYGTYHYSNAGTISWYDFAVAIRDLSQLDCIIHPIPTNDYPTPAKRPSYSVMDITKIEKDFSVQPVYWKDSLQQVLKKLVH